MPMSPDRMDFIQMNDEKNQNDDCKIIQERRDYGRVS